MSKQTFALWIPLLALTLATSGRLFGESIPVSVGFAGAPITPLVVTGTALTFESAATGSFLSSDPSLNAFWNPVAFDCHDTIDLTTGLDNAPFSFTFANGDTLFGNLVGDDSAVLATLTGPYTEILTFTGGTGEFLGATGSVSGGGLITGTGFTFSGSGNVSAPELVATPEPGTWLLLLSGSCGLAALGVRKRGITQRISC